jgi:FtsH-binding integral membrane protein
MELRSFMAGVFFLLGAELLLPLLGVKIAVTIPFAPGSTLVVSAVCLILAYYLFRGN